LSVAIHCYISSLQGRANIDKQRLPSRGREAWIGGCERLQRTSRASHPYSIGNRVAAARTACLEIHHFDSDTQAVVEYRASSVVRLHTSWAFALEAAVWRSGCEIQNSLAILEVCWD
jgi:hypothetical protein